LLGSTSSFSAIARYFALVPKTLLLRHRPQAVLLGRERRAVVEHDRRADRERAYEPVPHHPPTGREVEDAIVASQIGVQHELLEMLEQRAASPVDHAFRQARGA
jgi:hypothetical protein